MHEMKTSIIVDRDLWSEVKKYSTKLGTSANDIVVLGIKLVMSILRVGKIPEGLGEILSAHYPEALELLKKIVGRVG